MKMRLIRKTINAKSSSNGFDLSFMVTIKNQNRYGSFIIHNLFSESVTRHYIKNIKAHSNERTYAQKLKNRSFINTFNISYHSKSIGRLIRWRL